MRINNISFLQKELLKSGYIKDGEQFVNDDFRIKFNKKTISMKGTKGSQLTFANPQKITVKDLEDIILRAMV